MSKIPADPYAGAVTFSFGRHASDMPVRERFGVVEGIAAPADRKAAV